MKVVAFNHSFFLLSETFIYRQVRGLPENIDTTLVSYNFLNQDLYPTSNDHVELKRSANIPDKAINNLLPFIPKRLGFSLFNYFKVKKLLKEIKPDAIHAHFGFNARDVYPLAKSLKIPLIVSFHGVDASPECLKNTEYKNTIAKIIEYASDVIIVSPHMAETLQLSKSKTRVHLIPYGVDTAEFTSTLR